jgi:hypothetical protein
MRMPASRVTSLSESALNALNTLHAADGDITWPLQGLRINEDDDQLVIGIDFGTTYVFLRRDRIGQGNTD